MPRDNKTRSTLLPAPVAIIDLTEDSPSNDALRRSRARLRSDNSRTNNENSITVIPLDDQVEETASRGHRNKPPTYIVNLDETIVLDDSIINKNVINKPSTSFSSPPQKKDLTCPICFENLTNENLTPMTTPCGHIYCLECLKKVTHAKKKCSLCQRSLTFSKCIRLHI